MQLTEVRCCCNADNLIGYLPSDVTDYELRELDDGTFAFDSNHDEEGVKSRPDFIPVGEDIKAGKGGKTWKKGPKTWKK